MTIPNHIKIKSKLKFTAAVVVAAGIFASCEKKFDYSRPADTVNTVQGDIDSAFSYLIQAGETAWAWKFANTVSGNKFPEIILNLSKDSTADLSFISARGLVNDLTALRNSGTLTTAESADALSLINSFASFRVATSNLRGTLDRPTGNDPYLRTLMDNPANLSFRNRLLALLPNYLNFNGLVYFAEEQNAVFNVNSVVQTSLTFQKSLIFPYLKEKGVVDFDHRLMKFSKDSISLSSYHNALKNVNTSLYPYKVADVTPFVNTSALIININPLKANVSARVNSTTIAVPTGYNSVLDYFYKSYNQAYSTKYATYGFEYNGLGSTVQPAVLRDAVFVTPISAYSGNAVTAPTGTVLFTMALKSATDITLNLEIVKN